MIPCVATSLAPAPTWHLSCSSCYSQASPDAPVSHLVSRGTEDRTGQGWGYAHTYTLNSHTWSLAHSHRAHQGTHMHARSHSCSHSPLPTLTSTLYLHSPHSPLPALILPTLTPAHTCPWPCAPCPHSLLPKLTPSMLTLACTPPTHAHICTIPARPTYAYPCSYIPLLLPICALITLAHA